MQEITATIKDDGTIEIETSGFKGAACIKELDQITKSLELMGIKTQVKDQKKKPEYYQVSTTTTAKTGR